MKVYTEIIAPSTYTHTHTHTHTHVYDASWTVAIELISSRGRLDTFEQTFQNPLYTDDDDDNTIELDKKTSGRLNPKKLVSASQF